MSLDLTFYILNKKIPNDTDVHSVSPTHLMKLPHDLVDLFVSILPCGHGN
jgi:hypothetical protein